MENTINNLKYDYNFNLFLVKALIPELENMGDKIVVSRWLQKLDRCACSVDEMRLRNEFLYHLLLSIQSGTLRPPFNSRPPSGSIMTFEHLLAQAQQYPAEDAEEAAEDDAGAARKPMVYARSPDEGAFLAAQPVPRAGAFAYLAVLCKPS